MLPRLKLVDRHRHKMMGIRVTTDRLELIAGPMALARAEVCNRLEFSHLLDAPVPGSWQPLLEDADTMELNSRRLEEAPDETGRWTWYPVGSRQTAEACHRSPVQESPIEFLEGTGERLDTVVCPL
jgi:hypothetical protein